MSIKYIACKIAFSGLAGTAIFGLTGTVQNVQANQALQDRLSILADPGLPADAGIPAHGLQDAINWVLDGVNNISSYLYGKDAAYPFTGDSEAENAPNPQVAQIYKQFAETGNPLIRARDSKGVVRYIEVLSEGPDGGRGRYEDEVGILGEITWDREREVRTDEHLARSLVGQTIGTAEVEPIKALREGFGSTATVVARNGKGGITELQGDLASRIYQIQNKVEEMHAALPANTAEAFQTMQSTLMAQMARLNNRMDCIEKALAAEKDKTMGTRIQQLQEEVYKITYMLHLLFLVTPHLHCDHVKINVTSQIKVPENWNQ